MKVKHFIKNVLSQYGEDDNIAVLVFAKEDVIEKAKEMGFKLTDAQAEEIVQNVDDGIDCDAGFSWESVESEIEKYSKEHDLRTYPTCDQCSWDVINGVFCHEKGCPNQHKEWNEIYGEWIDPFAVDEDEESWDR